MWKRKTGRKAAFSAKGEAASYNGAEGYSMDVALAESLGYTFSDTKDRIWEVLDYYIAL